MRWVRFLWRRGGMAVQGPHGPIARAGDLHRLLRALFLCEPSLNVFLVQYGATAPVRLGWGHRQAKARLNAQLAVFPLPLLHHFPCDRRGIPSCWIWCACIFVCLYK